jgi:uncharacterized membrane protein/protein-disulfide isomerase
MSKTAARLAIGCALTGLVASATAAYVHYRLLVDPSYLSFCDVGATLNCTRVYASPFGSIGGVSVALLGTIGFAIATLLTAAAVTAPPAVRDNIADYLFVGSTLALAVVLYLGYASFVLLKLVCPLCFITYLAAIGLFLATGSASRRPMLSIPGRAVSDLKLVLSHPIALLATALLVAGAFAALAWFPRAADPGGEAAVASGGDDERARFEQWFSTQPRVSLGIPPDGAAVLVVKFNDYQCPPCRQTYVQYRDVFAKYGSMRPGAVRLVLRDFPLERECNAGVATDLHAAACEAAVAVRLAREAGRSEALEEWLFERQPSLTPEVVREGARQIGGVADYADRYEATLQAVRADIALGRRFGVRATPTFFINGVMIQGGLPPHLFDQAIGYELEQAASQ